MSNDAERVRNWRDRQKAAGKSSMTVLLSQEARQFLAEQKQITGESYAAIIERALHGLKKHDYNQPILKRVARGETIKEKVSASDRQLSLLNFEEREPEKTIKKVLIDDLSNYPNLKDIEQEQAAKGQSRVYSTKSKDGFFLRLFRSSLGSFGWKKRF